MIVELDVQASNASRRYPRWESAARCARRAPARTRPAGHAASRSICSRTGRAQTWSSRHHPHLHHRNRVLHRHSPFAFCACLANRAISSAVMPLVVRRSAASSTGWRLMMSEMSEDTRPARARRSSASHSMIFAIALHPVLGRRRELVPLDLRQVGRADSDHLRHFTQPDLLAFPLAADERPEPLPRSRHPVLARVFCLGVAIQPIRSECQLSSKQTCRIGGERGDQSPARFGSAWAGVNGSDAQIPLVRRRLGELVKSDPKRPYDWCRPLNGPRSPSPLGLGSEAKSAHHLPESDGAKDGLRPVECAGRLQDRTSSHHCSVL